MKALQVAYTVFLVLLFSTVAALVWWLKENPASSIVETRNEHLVWSSDGCKVYQVVIKNEWGTHILFITTPTREQTPLKQAVYPTCRVTALP